MDPSAATHAELEREAAVRRRLMEIGTGLFGPIVESNKQFGATVIIAAGLGIAMALITRIALAGAVMTAVVAGVGTLAAWSWLSHRPYRAVFELIRDHDCHERAAWKAETGTKMPNTVKEARRWLERNGGKPGTAAMLTRLGRLEASNAALDALEPTSPEDAFSVELQRRSNALYAGERPDITDLPARWLALPDTRERRHVRECLALLDAQVAVVEGRDPWPVLAAARSDIPEVHPSMRTSRWIAILVGIDLVAAVGVWALVTVILGA